MRKPQKKELDKYVIELTNWIEERKKTLDYSLEQFDKLIITLSSGSLIFSVGFVKDIVKITEDTETQCLKVSWCLFALSLISVLISQITSYFTNNLEIRLSIDEIKQIEKDKNYDDSKFCLRKKRFLIKFYNFSTILFNIISFLSLLLGIVIFIIFINQNI